MLQLYLKESAKYSKIIIIIAFRIIGRSIHHDLRSKKMPKKDFWDESFEEKQLSRRKKRKEQKHIIEDTQMVVVDDKFHPTESAGFKTLMKVLMFVFAMALALALFVFYRYYSDRKIGNTLSTSYFDSKGFSEEFNHKAVELIKLAGAVEATPEILNEENQADLASLAESYMGSSNSNFSYLVYREGSNTPIVSNGDDAVSRIESSKHYIKISTKNDDFNVETSLRGNSLDQADWKDKLSTLDNNYVMYMAVDNSLTAKDNFYDSYMRFNRTADFFGIAKIVGLAALAGFLFCLIFCTIATGKSKDSGIIKLTWFDRIFTEFGFIIVIAVLGAIIFGVWKCFQAGFAYRYYVLAAAVVIGYIIASRSYLSLVRRIKSGEFIDNSLLYMAGSRINSGLNHLPAVLKYALVILFLVALNGGLIYFQMKGAGPKISGIPIIFIISGIVFFIEFVVFLSALFMKDRPDVDEEPEVQEEDEEENLEDYFEIDQSIRKQDPLSGEIPEPEIDDNTIYGVIPQEVIDQSNKESDAEAEPGTYDSQENIMSGISDSTVVLGTEEEDRLKAAEEAAYEEGSEGEENTSDDIKEASEETAEESFEEGASEGAEEAIPEENVGDAPAEGDAAPGEEAEGSVPDMEEDAAVPVPDFSMDVPDEPVKAVDLVELTKKIRRELVDDIKARDVVIALRSPGKEVEAEMRQTDANDFVRSMISNVIKYTASGEKSYIETYTQNMYKLYIAKITMAHEDRERAERDLAFDLGQAKYLAERYKGRFVYEIGDKIIKVGVLLK